MRRIFRATAESIIVNVKITRNWKKCEVKFAKLVLHREYRIIAQKHSNNSAMFVGRRISSVYNPPERQSYHSLWLTGLRSPRMERRHDTSLIINFPLNPFGEDGQRQWPIAAIVEPNIGSQATQDSPSRVYKP